MKRVIFALTIGVVACDAAKIDLAQPHSSPTEKQAPSETPTTPAPKTTRSNVEQAYDFGWHISNGWPGEWPASFAVEAEGVIIRGRPRLAPEAPKSIACVLPQYAHYHPWNHQGRGQETAIYRSAQEIIKVTMHEEVSISVESEYPQSQPLVLELKPEEYIEIIRYYGEGYQQIRYRGSTYKARALINSVQIAKTVEPISINTHLWVQVTCLGGARAWIIRREALEIDGIEVSGTLQYGRATDLDHPDFPTGR